MRILALDTSSERGSVALTLNGEPGGEVRLGDSVQHSERLFRSIDFLLETSGVRVEDVDLFVAARGPGSFTGLRVGLAAVEGLAFTAGRPVRAISTLAAIAWQIGPSTSPIAPLIDARRGEVYGALFRREGPGLVEVRGPGAERPDRFLGSLPDEPVVFCGPGVKHCMAEIRMHTGWTIGKADPYLAMTLAEMAAAGHDEPFEPLYLRAPGSVTRSQGT